MEQLSTSPEEYISRLPEERRAAMEKLRLTIRGNLPVGYEETMSYGMIAYVVPHRLYPSGYHVKPEEPLPFISIASQKNYIALYHMGLYMNQELLNWFRTEYPKVVPAKLDMGKSCIRFKQAGSIPYGLIAELCGKISAEEYISSYEQELSRSRKK
ncbi:hypothetical protein D3C73_945330 [compost metagenome]